MRAVNRSQPHRHPAPELLKLASAALGEVTSVQDLSWGHGESEVWRVTSAQGNAILKAHRQRRKFLNELEAYRLWAPLLRPALQPGSAVPELLAARSESPRALLLGWHPGELLERLRLPRPSEAAVHERAGQFLRALHDLPVADTDALPLAHAYRQRIRTWGERAAGIVPDALIHAVTNQAEGALPFIAACARVPCHRDYTPRNWLVGMPAPGSAAPAGARVGADAADAAGAPRAAGAPSALVVIDFEHSQPDLYLADLQRLWVGAWRQRPDLKSAFLTGYGRRLSTAEEDALRSLSALWGLSTIVWARAHADVAFEEAGWEALRWLGLA